MEHSRLFQWYHICLHLEGQSKGLIPRMDKNLLCVCVKHVNYFLVVLLCSLSIELVCKYNIVSHPQIWASES